VADDLDDFLKQAAQRRQQRQQNKGVRPPLAQPPLAQSSSEQQSKTPRRVEPPRQKTEIATAEVVSDMSSYRPTIGNLAATLPSASVSDSVDQADERMQSHVSEVFQHEISKLRSSPSSRESVTDIAAKSLEYASNVSAASMIKQLREPSTLRMAIIAHEIMKRPWE
jgi:hypothetical protein